MSQVFANLSGKPLEQFKTTIDKLEQMSGFPSEDVRHFSKTSQALRKKIGQLGLDPDDTTGEELYCALQARYQADAASLDRALGINSDSTLKQRLAKAAALVKHCSEQEEVWALKNSVAKKLIRQNAPKKLMRMLHYRSVDSLLKRENVATVLMSADLIESQAWHKKLASQLHKLNTTNFELRSSQFINLPAELNTQLTDQQTFINGISGAVALSSRLPNDTPVLTLTLLLLDASATLSENHQSHKLHDVHPALLWWQDTEHLLSFNNGQPVSLNFRDIAQNHLLRLSYGSHIAYAGQQAFWVGLMNRYRKYVDELPQGLSLLKSDLNLNRTLRPARELVPQPIEVELEV